MMFRAILFSDQTKNSLRRNLAAILAFSQFEKPTGKCAAGAGNIWRGLTSMQTKIPQ
jgi:hypothetical protein